MITNTLFFFTSYARLSPGRFGSVRHILVTFQQVITTTQSGAEYWEL